MLTNHSEDLRLEMSEDSDHEQQRFEDPGGEVYNFFRYLYELDPTDSHLAYEAWYEITFEEKTFWAKILHLEQRLGVSYQGGGTDSSVPQIPSDIIELGISAATKVRGFPLQYDAQLKFEFSAVTPAVLYHLKEVPLGVWAPRIHHPRPQGRRQDVHHNRRSLGTRPCTKNPRSCNEPHADRDQPIVIPI